MQNEATTELKEFKRPKTVGAGVLAGIGITLVVLGITSSYFFSRTIEKFFWEVHTSYTLRLIEKVSGDLQESDISQWSDAGAAAHIEKFASEFTQNTSSIAAIKIYAPNGVLAWTNLKDVSAGYKEPGIEDELAGVEKMGHTIQEASESTKLEVNKTELLEIWTTLKNPQGNSFGFVELYFDSSEISSFIKKIQYSIWISISVVLIIVLVLLRVAFRRQNEIIIKQASELSSLIENSPIGIYSINAKGLVTSINPRMLKLLGEVDRSHVVGKSIFDIKRVQALSLSSEIREALSGKSFEKEARAMLNNGEEIHRHYQGTPLFADDNKTVTQVFFMVEDITEHKKLEKNLFTQAQNLESTVADRTKSLQEKIDELERFERLTVDREIRMTELKQQIEKMRIKLESLGVDTNIYNQG